METPFEAGHKIQYRLFDKNGKEHWVPGIVHGVRRYEDAATNMITRITYLVDTGRDERVDEFPFDHRDREIERRANKLVSQGEDPVKAMSIVLNRSDLPESKRDIELVRQPEQIELPAEHIRSAE